MPIKPPPHTIKCTACNWSKTVEAPSDMLVNGHSHFDICPKCGSAALQKGLPNPFALMGMELGKIAWVFRS